MRKFSLSPALFLILEFFILLPSCLFVFAFILAVFHNPYLFKYLISGSIFKIFCISIVSPVAGGFLAYQYIERYKVLGGIKKIARIILGYSIIEVGLVVMYLLLVLFGN